MNDALKRRVGTAFRLTEDLVAHLDESALRRDIPGVASNRIAAQLWCVVGARESYLRAIRAGEWQGFACSLQEPGRKDAVSAALGATADELSGLPFDGLSDGQIDVAFALLEHEVQHHGQLIRYVYANGLTFPGSWTERYTV